MIPRRWFVTRLPLAMVAAPLPVEAHQAGKVYRVGLIFLSPPISEMTGAEPVNNGARALVRGLRALGYVEGRNLILERPSAEERFERFAPIVAELVASRERRFRQSALYPVYAREDPQRLTPRATDVRRAHTCVRPQ